MNDKKISFIYCVNDYSLFEESVEYIRALTVPVGYEIEIIPVENAPSMTSGYNQAMKSSDAKYKVYLHQDVFIINKNFIIDFLSVFNDNSQVAMLGVAGAKSVPINGVWWDSKENYGKVYDSHTGKMELLYFNEVTSIYEKVQAIDGLIMITQYDLPWREDLFTGWHFYDLSQSMEFINAGYEVGIPKQEEPWCIHDCGLVNVENGYGEFKNLFIDEYLKCLFPLVSILIPTYNQTVFLKEALESAINQTYPNIEIIIGDDSTNDDVWEFLKPYLSSFKNIRYLRNKKNAMDYGVSNLENLLRESKGQYVNYLFHDDVFHETKIERMVNYFLKDDQISLVTSHRQLINEKGEYLLDNLATKKLFEKDTLLNGKGFVLNSIRNLTNFIGEPTTVLFNKDSLVNGFGHFMGHNYVNIGDLATWTSLLLKGKAVYISDTLSYFREHTSQNSQKVEVKLMGVEEWKKIIDDCYQIGLIDTDLDYQLLLLKWFYSCNYAIHEALTNDIDENLKLKIKNAFTSTMDTLFENTNFVKKNQSSNKILILDDNFPNLLTSFRVAEFNYYLENDIAEVFSGDPLFEENINEYSKKYPELKKRIKLIANLTHDEDKKLVYTIFLNNIYRYLPIIETLNLPFIFTLYPGGGFCLNQKESDYKLKKVCNSPLLKKIIVTQKITYDYLINKEFVNPDKIEFIYGGVLASEFYNKNFVNKKFFKKDKMTFDICFVANKYMKNGLDKGYDVFIKVCKELAKIHKDIHFHVVGGFNELDVSIEDLENRIHFYGTQYMDFFPKFYSSMDIILSPNKSNVLSPGSFDGFPTGCCVEAAFSEVAVFCTDDLNNNSLFKDDEDICIINRSTEDIVNKILYYYDNVDGLYLLAKSGRKKMLNVLDYNDQMSKRIKILKQFL